MFYLLFLALYSYMMTVELSPGSPLVAEILIWVWALTMWLDELRQV